MTGSWSSLASGVDDLYVNVALVAWQTFQTFHECD